MAKVPYSRAKLRIGFRHRSSLRRNVDKHIFRFILANYAELKKLITDELAIYGYKAQAYDFISDRVEELKEVEASHDKKVKHSYTKAIDIFLSHDAYSIVMKACLCQSLKKQKAGNAARMSEANQAIYKHTIEDYIAFIANQLNTPRT